MCFRMCWFHMRKSAEKQLSIIESKETRTKIMQDIDALQKFINLKLIAVGMQIFYHSALRQITDLSRQTMSLKKRIHRTHCVDVCH